MQITTRTDTTKSAALLSPMRRNLRLSPLAFGTLLACGQIAAATHYPDSTLSSRAHTALLAPGESPEGPWAARYFNAFPGAPASKSLGPAPAANTIVVLNCNDAGAGSLRQAVIDAASGDTIDLASLSCTRITLTTGAINFSQGSLTLLGPASGQLRIDGGYSTNHFNRILDHRGTGTLTISDLTLTDAKYSSASGNAAAACISSFGTVSLTNTTVSNCTAKSQGTNATQGGGIFAEKGITLMHSKVTGNTAISSSTGFSLGGGISSFGGITMKYSTVSDNATLGPNFGEGGGINASDGNVYIFDSTISGNAAIFCGGMHITDTGSHSMQILNTTISENHADSVGGLCVATPITLSNSTIAFNTSGTVYSGTGFFAIGANAVNINSTIIANNSAGGSDDDVNIDASATVTGANNLITQHIGTVPADTITACPLIGPLGNQGGSTLTHRLLLGSPALDAGNNVNTLGFDQRGSGYPRTFGSQTDIGAFESQGTTPQEIFSGGFEGRCR